MVLKLFDYDSAGYDELVGSMIFSIKDIVNIGEEGEFNWINIYGAPVDVSGDWSKKMNNNPEYASTWKGRVLVHY